MTASSPTTHEPFLQSGLKTFTCDAKVWKGKAVGRSGSTAHNLLPAARDPAGGGTFLHMQGDSHTYNSEKLAKMRGSEREFIEKTTVEPKNFCNVIFYVYQNKCIAGIDKNIKNESAIHV